MGVTSVNLQAQHPGFSHLCSYTTGCPLTCLETQRVPKAEQAVLLEFGNFDKDYVLHFSRLTILTIDQDCRP